MKVVTDLNGRRLSSLPKPKRRAAANAVAKQLETPSYAKVHQDPAEVRHLAHRAANSLVRNQPTKGTQKKDAIRRSIEG